MSVPLTMTATQLHSIAAALEAMTEMTTNLGVVLYSPGRGCSMELNGTCLHFAWDGDAKAYVIDDALSG